MLIKYRIFLYAVAVVAAVLGAYHFWFSPTAHYKRQVQLALDGLSKAVESQKPALVRDALDKMIGDAARINLDVYFPMPGQPHKPQPPQPFGKADFIAFVDNILYSVNGYHFRASANTLVLSNDKASGVLDFTSDAGAHGVSTVLMEASSQFSAQSSCHATVLFDAAAKPSLSDLSCEVQISR